MKAVPRIAVFPRGIDGLFLTSTPERPIALLVEEGRPECRWAKRFAKERVVAYTLGGKTPLQELTTGEVLHGSNIAQALRDAHCSHVFLHSSLTPDISRWARTQHLGLAAVKSSWARSLEHKIAFDRFLTKHAIPRPASVSGRAGKLDPLPFVAGAVAQQPESMGGEGTFFLAAGARVKSLIDAGALKAQEPCLVREFVTGRSLGITLLVAHDVAALSGVRLQCYYPSQPGASSRVFAGIQWLPYGALSARLARRIEQTFLSLSRTLHAQGFRGFANVDFICTESDEVRVIECNPRPSAATPALFVWPELMAGLDVSALFLDAVLSRPRTTRRLKLLGLPRADFAGATLDVVAGATRDVVAGATRDVVAGATRDGAASSKPATVRRTVQSGVYRVKARGSAGEFEARGSRRERRQDNGMSFLGPDPRLLGPRGTLFAYASIKRGERYASDATLVNVYSSVPLYDRRGRLNRCGQRVLSAFKVT